MISTLLFTYFFFSCAVEKQYLSYDGNTQGTSFHIVYETEGYKDYRSAVDSIFHIVNVNFSLWDTASVISQLNRNCFSGKLSPVFIEMFNRSFEVYKQSGGAFDPTVAPLVDLWGFGPGKNRQPDSSRVKEILKNVGMNKVQIKNGSLVKEHNKITLNFNAIAQGYTVDMIADFFEKEKVKNYLVEIGGEVRVKGEKKNGEKWRIGIDKPDDLNPMPGQEVQAIINLEDLSVSTSGNYRNFYVENGVKYAHTINPRTGMPAKSNLLSASVFANDCATADAYATAMMVVGKDEAIKLAARMKLDVYLIFSDEKGRIQVYLSEKVKFMLIN